MTDRMSELPQAEVADPDGVQVALRAAHTLWSHGDTAESLRWLRRAAESASDEGADQRSLQLAKAAAELRSRFGESRPPGSSPVAGGQLNIPVAKQGPTHNGYGTTSPQPSGAAASVPSRAQARAPAPAMAQPTNAEATLPLESVPPPLPVAEQDAEELEAEALPDDAVVENNGGAEPAPSAMQTWLASEPPVPGHSSEVGQSIPPPLPQSSYSSGPEPQAREEQPTIALPSEEEAAEVLDDLVVSQGADLVQGTPDLRAVESRSGSTVAVDELASRPPPSSRIPSSSAPTRPGEALAEVASNAPKLTARVHHQAVRVAISTQSSGEGCFTVRPLREGEAPPAGERVALLVALEPGSPLV